MRHKKRTGDQAVSEVVGEMLMIGIVLILAAVFTSQLPNYLPSERSPSVTVMMSTDTFGDVTLWHKGGDWVKVSTLKVISRIQPDLSPESVSLPSQIRAPSYSSLIQQKPTILRRLISVVISPLFPA